MGRLVWDLVETNYGLTAEMDGLRAVVVRVGVDGTTQFMLLKREARSGTGRLMLVEYGRREGVRQAMEAAERALIRHYLAA